MVLCAISQGRKHLFSHMYAYIYIYILMNLLFQFLTQIHKIFTQDHRNANKLNGVFLSISIVVNLKLKWFSHPQV